ncbi:uncharacterized protein LOC123644553 isoform X3 [Lemur catta]|uniref:uncharacterized protein LOC123644553 isoform X3 n=1 Tax=Lemur catta TaxID=9447 RepID=UPI001E2690B4|nr:uncharacterized protein LOC123644553 isoform X3 [Lemur catta]
MFCQIQFVTRRTLHVVFTKEIALCFLTFSSPGVGITDPVGIRLPHRRRWVAPSSMVSCVWVHWGQSPTREPEVGVLLALPPMHCAAPDLASLGFSFHKSRKDPRSCTLGAGPLLARGCSPFLLGRVLGEGDRERSGTGRGSPLCLCPVLFAPAAQGPALHTLAGDWENHHAEPGETCTKQASRNGDDPKGSTSQTTRLTLEAAWCPPSCPPAPARWTAPARDPHFHFLSNLETPDVCPLSCPPSLCLRTPGLCTCLSLCHSSSSVSLKTPHCTWPSTARLSLWLLRVSPTELRVCVLISGSCSGLSQPFAGVSHL